MKRVILLSAILIALPFVLKADPPKKVNLTFNAENHKLKIEAVHPVQNVEKHYIDLISVSVNGKEVKTINLQKHSDKKGELVEVEIPQIIKGCEVVVKARCNQFGTKKETLSF
jgi:hypothetical protein